MYISILGEFCFDDQPLVFPEVSSYCQIPEPWSAQTFFWSIWLTDQKVYHIHFVFSWARYFFHSAHSVFLWVLISILPCFGIKFDVGRSCFAILFTWLKGQFKVSWCCQSGHWVAPSAFPWTALDQWSGYFCLAPFWANWRPFILYLCWGSW